MKVLLDTNVYLSYLLAPTQPKVITRVVRSCLEQDEIDLVVPREQIDELMATATTKPYFRTRIARAVLDILAAHLAILAELTSPLDEILAFGRDPKDDYLVTFCVLHDVEYLVTGDDDLLALSPLGELAILTPAVFLTELRGRGLAVS